MVKRSTRSKPSFGKTASPRSLTVRDSLNCRSRRKCSRILSPTFSRVCAVRRAAESFPSCASAVTPTSKDRQRKRRIIITANTRTGQKKVKAGQTFGQHELEVSRGGAKAPFRRLVSSLTAQHDSEGSDDDFQVGAQRPALYVTAFEPHDLFEVSNEVPTIYLPGTREPWHHAEAYEMPRLIFLNFGGKWGPRPNERHVPAKDIQKLRQFIQTEPSQEPTDPSHSWI